jgi:hypothetical protein
MRAFLTAVSVCLVAPSLASAQPRILIQAFGGRSLPVNLEGGMASGSQPLSEAECLANQQIQFEITNIPATATMTTNVFAVWRASRGTACTMASQRMPMGGTPPCTFVVASPAITMTTMTMTIGASELFGGDCTMDDEFQFNFLIVPSASDTATEVAATNAASVIIKLDVTPPDAPTLGGPAAGDTMIEVVWDNPDGVEPLHSANVYVDTAGCDASGNVIPGSALTGGGAPPSGVMRYAFEGTAVESATLNGETLGLMEDEWAAVAVTIVDRARNESVLSTPVCIQRVNVVGIPEDHCMERGLSIEECAALYRCAAAPGAGRSWLAAIGLAAIGLTLALRRRGRR